MTWCETWDQVGKGDAAAAAIEINDDLPLPFGVRLGSVVHLHKTAFFRACGNGSLLPIIDDARPAVESIARMVLSNGSIVYRFYLTSSGLDPDHTFLEVLVDSDGQVGQLLYGRPLTALAVDVADERQAFAGEQRIGAGAKVYALYRDELSDLGFDEPELNAVMGTSDSLEYLRENTMADEFVTPIRGEDCRIADRRGFTGRDRVVWSAPYSRQIGADKEFLLIQASAPKGATGPLKMSVDFALGLQLDVSRISVER
jgi:hypothetical protein